MLANPPRGYPRVAPYLLYEDPAAALEWLGSAFGLRERFRHEFEGVINHAEMVFADGLVMLANPGRGYRSPRRHLQATAITHIYVPDLRGHFNQAKQAGAEIRAEPEEKPYGTIQYSAIDPEGHVWLFSEQVREPDPEWVVG
jgi:uncharacterized glyoxalase superfamily protein PhnB